MNVLEDIKDSIDEIQKLDSEIEIGCYIVISYDSVMICMYNGCF